MDAHPETIILDPLPAIRTLLDRCKSYQLIHKIEDCMQGRQYTPTHQPTWSGGGPQTVEGLPSPS